MDAISEGDSFRNIVKMMGQRGKQLNVMLPVPDDVRKINPELKIEFTGVRTLWGAVSPCILPFYELNIDT